jgi:hypothetical protein
VRLEGLNQLKKKKFNDLIGNRTRILPACSIVPQGRDIAQAVSRWIPTAAAPGSNPGIVMWDLWWGRFSPSTSFSPANFYSANFSTITITYHPVLVQ